MFSILLSAAVIYNEHMFLPGVFLWWYTNGWRDQVNLLIARLSGVSDRFSIELLLKSLFTPFRQTFADGGGPSFDAKLRAWADRTISRGIGAMVRSALIITGTLLLLFECAIGLIRLAVWPLIPVLPVIGLLLMASGWIPWQV